MNLVINVCAFGGKFLNMRWQYMHCNHGSMTPFVSGCDLMVLKRLYIIDCYLNKI